MKCLHVRSYLYCQSTADLLSMNRGRRPYVTLCERPWVGREICPGFPAFLWDPLLGKTRAVYLLKEILPKQVSKYDKRFNG